MYNWLIRYLSTFKLNLYIKIDYLNYNENNNKNYEIE